ncbi:hypothetical protein C8F04DRAFT_1276714 [Mycena alexandri]|uniref:F-box domain-containing protein n=1 Tax=Mycena alexandri TaxID=1745969 RepID=A0AAD6WPM6_9AGAR|nr:hypothetical protein C8F04DRAFT_1276714 [Mycena alexandri]
MSAPASVPILRLPAELLSSIFVDVVDPFHVDWLDIINARGHLVSVCARWRTVAASTPALWSRIYIAPAFLPSFISTSLGKTANADLFVQINPHVFRTIEQRGARRALKFLLPEEFLKQTVSLLRAEFHRVRSLEVFDGYMSQMLGVMEMVSTFQAQRLSSLRLSASDTYSNCDGVPSLPTGIRPTRLSVRRVEPLWKAPELYSEVTTLSLARLSWLRWADLQPILRSNLVLRELRLSNVQCSIPVSPAKVTLPNLTIFKLRYETKADRRFVGFIDMPSLQSFELLVSGSGTLDGVSQDMPNVLRSAVDVFVEVERYISDDLTEIVALCTSAHMINLRECRPLPYRALLRLRSYPNFSLPLLKVIKISDSLTKDDALALLALPFGGDLAVNEWVLGDWVCREWRMVDGKLTRKVIEGDSGRAGFLVRN